MGEIRELCRSRSGSFASFYCYESFSVTLGWLLSQEWRQKQFLAIPCCHQKGKFKDFIQRWVLSGSKCHANAFIAFNPPFLLWNPPFNLKVGVGDSPMGNFPFNFQLKFNQTIFFCKARHINNYILLRFTQIKTFQIF